MRRTNSVRGSLTVFLSLLLAVFLAFNGVCLAYARAQVIRTQVQTAASSAVESIFAGYCAPLFARYQLLARLIPQGEFSELEKETSRYAAAFGGAAESGNATSYASLTAFDVTQSSWSDVVFVTDENGAVFAEMAEAAMKASAGEILVEEWKKKLGFGGDAKQEAILNENADRDELSATELLSGYEDWESSFEQVQESYQDPAEESAENGIGAETSGNEQGEEGGSVSTSSSPSASAGEGNTFLEMLESLRKVLAHGILGIVVPQERTISAAGISAKNLPSSLSAGIRARTARKDSQMANALLLREYLMRNIDCFTSQSEKTPAYELEYIVAGRQTDEDNLKSVVHRILWIRLGFNLMYLSQSPNKLAQVREAATLAVGWTGMPALVEGLVALLLTAWAFAEGLVDARTLLAGGKVSLIKTDENWQTSLEHAADAWEKTAGQSANSSEDEKGLSYEDYLRICLYLTSTETLCYRAMDVIQWNLQKLDASFVMADCIVEGTLSLTVQAEDMFAPLYGSLLTGNKNKRWEYTRTGCFSYFNNG